MQVRGLSRHCWWWGRSEGGSQLLRSGMCAQPLRTEKKTSKRDQIGCELELHYCTPIAQHHHPICSSLENHIIGNTKEKSASSQWDYLSPGNGRKQEKQPKWRIAKSDVTPKRCSFMVFKEHWNFSEPMSGGHSLFGCYRQYHQKRKGSPPFYVHELLLRNPQKTCSPLPVAKYLTSDHITASVTYFLEALMTDVTRAFGHKAMHSPVMLICDGSMALIAV